MARGSPSLAIGEPPDPVARSDRRRPQFAVCLERFVLHVDGSNRGRQMNFLSCVELTKNRIIDRYRTVYIVDVMHTTVLCRVWSSEHTDTNTLTRAHTSLHEKRSSDVESPHMSSGCGVMSTCFGY